MENITGLLERMWVSTINHYVDLARATGKLEARAALHELVNEMNAKLACPLFSIRHDSSFFVIEFNGCRYLTAYEHSDTGQLTVDISIEDDHAQTILGLSHDVFGHMSRSKILTWHIDTLQRFGSLAIRHTQFV